MWTIRKDRIFVGKLINKTLIIYEEKSIKKENYPKHQLKNSTLLKIYQS